MVRDDGDFVRSRRGAAWGLSARRHNFTPLSKSLSLVLFMEPERSVDPDLLSAGARRAMDQY